MSYKGIRKNVENKPLKLSRLERFNKTKPRKFGKVISPCRVCGTRAGVIRKYGILYCRKCFREQAERLGFEKFQ